MSVGWQSSAVKNYHPQLRSLVSGVPVIWNTASRSGRRKIMVGKQWLLRFLPSSDVLLSIHTSFARASHVATPDLQSAEGCNPTGACRERDGVFVNSYTYHSLVRKDL